MWHYNESQKNILGQNLKKEKQIDQVNNVYYIYYSKKNTVLYTNNMYDRILHF